MQDILDTLVAEAQDNANACKYPGASATINGHEVLAYIVEQYRRTTFTRKTQKPSVMWKVDGKRVSAANLMAAIQG